jgi:sigma-B regulation protein RsbU (phosphoserine phosphatase)
MDTDMKLLIADDDPTIPPLLTHVLAFVEAEVLVARDGDTAAALWLQERPQLVLTDWMMPGADGAALCHLIRQTPGADYTYIIMLTACETPSEIVRGLEAGADDYVTKPFHRAELVMRVKCGLRVLSLEAALSDRIARLENALARVKVLEGLLPICSYCKKIRDDAGEWQGVEHYLGTRTDVDFTHGICPTCLARASGGRLGVQHRDRAT